MKLDENKRIPYEVHYEHHIWTEGQKAAQEKKAERWAKFWMDIGKGVLLGAIFGILGLAVYGWQVKQFEEYAAKVEMQGDQK